MASYVNLDTIQRPSGGAQILATWGDQVNDNFTALTTATTYTPSWIGATTNPTLGNGTLTARYQVLGKMCWLSITLAAGTTTTVGSGSYHFSLPVQAASMAGEQVLSAELYDGANHYAGSALINSGDVNNIYPFSTKGGTSGSTVSMAGGSAFGAGQAAFISISGVYLTA